MKYLNFWLICTLGFSYSLFGMAKVKSLKEIAAQAIIDSHQSFDSKTMPTEVHREVLLKEKDYIFAQNPNCYSAINHAIANELMSEDCLDLIVNEKMIDLHLLLENAINNNTSSIQLLCENYHTLIQFNRINYGDNCSLLHHAAQTGNIDVIKLLVRFGADPNLCKAWVTPLHNAKNPATIAALVEVGANINGKNEFNTPVMYYIEKFSWQPEGFEKLKKIFEYKGHNFKNLNDYVNNKLRKTVPQTKHIKALIKQAEARQRTKSCTIL